MSTSSIPEVYYYDEIPGIIQIGYLIGREDMTKSDWY